MDAQAKRDVAELRTSFRAGRMRTEQQRRDVLLGFQRMMVECREEMQKALWDDLHKSPSEAYFMEINQCEHEIQEQLDNLHHHMQPEKARNHPASASRRRPRPLAARPACGPPANTRALAPARCRPTS